MHLLLLPSSLPAAAVVNDDLPSGLGMPLPTVDFKEGKEKTSKFGQLEKTSGARWAFESN